MEKEIASNGFFFQKLLDPGELRSNKDVSKENSN